MVRDGARDEEFRIKRQVTARPFSGIRRRVCCAAGIRLDSSSFTTPNTSRFCLLQHRLHSLQQHPTLDLR